MYMGLRNYDLRNYETMTVVSCSCGTVYARDTRNSICDGWKLPVLDMTVQGTESGHPMSRADNPGIGIPGL